MAKQPTAGGASPSARNNLSDLRYRLLFVLGALVVFRIGTFITVPGINLSELERLLGEQQGTILGMFNMLSGGAFSRFGIFALGIMPYISASIIMQLLTMVVPALEQWRKEGDAGRRKITRWTRYGTVVLASFQAVMAATALQDQIAVTPGLGFVVTAAVSLVAGTMFLMWLGEQITERGIGNGISLLIFAGIVAGLPAALGGTGEMVSEGKLHALVALGILLLAFLVIGFVVFVERGQRRITVNYARRQQGRKVYAAQSSYLPLKLNMASVIPPIFASSIILFPASLARWLGDSQGLDWLYNISTKLSPGEPIYVLLYAALIVFFCFFYTALVFNARETAENLKRSGAFIPGIRPGEQTSKYIDSVLTKLTIAGAAYITIVCLLPEFLILNWKVPFYFGGTSLLIIVVVVMDFMAQVNSHLMSHQYEGLMKKANLKGNTRPGTVR